MVFLPGIARGCRDLAGADVPHEPALWVWSLCHCLGRLSAFQERDLLLNKSHQKDRVVLEVFGVFFFFFPHLFFFLGNRQISEGFGLVCLFVFPGSRLFGSIPSKHSAVPVLSAFARPASAAVSVAACFCAIWGNPLRQAAQR